MPNSPTPVDDDNTVTLSDQRIHDAMDANASPASSGKRIVPVVCVMSDGVTTLSRKIASLQSHIARTARIWQGSQEEYDSWATASIARALESFANRVACVPKMEG